MHICMRVCTCSPSLGANNYYQGKGARGGLKLGAHSQICKVGGYPVPRWVDTGVRQEAIRGHHRLLAAAETEGEGKGKALCAPLFSPALWMFVGSLRVGRMMVVGNRVFK